MNTRLSIAACVLLAFSAFRTSTAEVIVSLPWTSDLSAGTRAQNYPTAQDSLDIWAVEDFSTDRDWLLDTFSCSGACPGGGAAGTRDVFVLVMDAMPPMGRVVVQGVAGSGSCTAGAARNGWDTFSAALGGRRLPAGQYWVVWQADLSPTIAPAVMFSQGGPYAVGAGNPDSSWRYWPNQAGRTQLIGSNLDGSGPPIGTNFLITGRPAPCAADLTGDGGVTIEDLLLMIEWFEAGDGRADLDDGSGTGMPDGGVTIEDLLYFLRRYEEGC